MAATMLVTADKEFAREGDIARHITVHGVFAQQVNPEFLASLGESELAIQHEHVGENTAALPILDELEEFLGHFPAGFPEDSM